MRLYRPAPPNQQPLTLDETPEPKPGPGQIAINVHACGLCRTDLHLVEGDLPMRKIPVIPGHQAVGTVTQTGPDTVRFKPGDRVGTGWMHNTCGNCDLCNTTPTKENLCEQARFTGWTDDGGFAQTMIAQENFAYPLPENLPDTEAAPLLCAGIIGYRALKLTGISRGQRLGLFGFGSSAHLTIQAANHLGYETLVFTRNPDNQKLAQALGAAWTGRPDDDPDTTLHAAVIFAPAGNIVPVAMEKLAPGGTTALAGIHMTDVPAMQYKKHLYHEKTLRSVANATRTDAEEFLKLAATANITADVTTFGLREANEALVALKEGRIQGSAVLDVQES